MSTISAVVYSRMLEAFSQRVDANNNEETDNLETEAMKAGDADDDT